MFGELSCRRVALASDLGGPAVDGGIPGSTISAFSDEAGQDVKRACGVRLVPDPASRRRGASVRAGAQVRDLTGSRMVARS
jgi:hypothetical protein